MNKENEWEDDPDMQEFLEWADQPGPWDEEDDKIHTVGGLTNDKKNGFMSFVNKTKMSKVFLIEKAWIDPMENHNAAGYNIHSYMTNEDEAKEFCESKGYYTSNDCWQVKYNYGGKMPKYRYTELNQNKDE